MILTPKFWYKNDLLSKFFSTLFLPLSTVWCFFNYLKKSLSNPYKSRIKVICIGNINIGGSGKTPLCISLYKWLKKWGFEPIFLVGGYKAKTSGPIQVELNHNENIFGDESLLLAKVGPTIISKNRFLGIKFIENLKKKYDIVIMDDGIQNYQIYKNINLLAVDKNLLFGNEYCLPAGPLRETFGTCMRKIDAVIMTGNENKNQTKLNLKKPTFNSFISAKKNKFHNQKFLAFCGIANPVKFYDTLKLMNFNIVKSICFPDHYYYKENDIRILIEKAIKLNLKLITTEKDLVKINLKFHKFIDILPIEIKMSETDLKKFKLFIYKKINV